jgi:acid phosphatase type 7
MLANLTRRGFLAGVAGMAPFSGAYLLGQEKLPVPTPTDDDPAFKPDTLFLTWQRDPTTTITIQWIGRARDVDEPVIRYRERSKSDWAVGPIAKAKPFPVVELPVRGEGKDRELAPMPKGTDAKGLPTGPVDFSVFRAELISLTPGTEYEFIIGTRSKTYRFRTMPAKATKAFHFISGGDVGVNSHALANNRIAALQDPMFALIGGDLGYDNGVNGNTAVQFIRNYATTMIDSQGRLIPMVAMLGNHEVRGSYNKTLADATFFTPLFDGLFTETSYATLDFGDYLSLVLADTGHCAKIGGEQTEWLDKTLGDRAGRPHLIVAGHVPCYPSYRQPAGLNGKFGTGEEQRKHWVPLYEKHQVDVVLEHHDHTFKRTHPLTGGNVDDATGIVYVGDGSWGKLRIPRDADKRNYLADVSPDYHLTLHRLEGEQRFHLALGETGKVLDIFRTGKKPRRRTPGVTTG